MMVGNKRRRLTKHIHIPDDIVKEIFKRLPAKSLLRLRCASKMWCKIIDGVSFPNANQSLWAAKPQILPLFFGLESKGIKVGENPIREYLTMKDYRICDAAYGLLCIAKIDNPAQIFLCNPLRGEVLEVPWAGPFTGFRSKQKWIRRQMWLKLGFDCTTNTYKIVRFFYVLWEHVARDLEELDEKSRSIREYEVMELAAEIYTLGTDSWRGVPSALLPKLKLFGDYDGIVAYGDIHWRCITRRPPQPVILSFDFRKEKFKFNPAPDFRSFYSIGRLLFDLFDLEKSLAGLVTLPSGPRDIMILKHYGKEDQRWVRQYRLNIALPRIIISSVTSWGPWIIFQTIGGNGICGYDLKTNSIWYEEYPVMEESVGVRWSRIIIGKYTPSALSLKNFGKSVADEMIFH